MKIIFFDGYCNLCNGFVDWVVKRDTHAQFKFASLQSETAKKLLPIEISAQTTPESVILLKDSAYFEKSTAVLKILSDLGGPWKLASAFYVLPPFLRNGAYVFIARNRYRFFGKRDTCRLPMPEEKSRFLD